MLLNNPQIMTMIGWHGYCKMAISTEILENIEKGMNNMTKYIVEVGRNLSSNFSGAMTESLQKSYGIATIGILAYILSIGVLFGIYDTTQVAIASPLKSSWDFFDDLSDWKRTGWYITKDSQMDWQGNPSKNGEIIQNSNGTVTIRDTNEFGRFYMGRDVNWTTPFTLQIRMKIRLKTTSAQFPFIQANIVGNVNAVLSSVDPDKAPFGFDPASFHTYTMVVSEKNSVDIYLDENFKRPIISKPLDNVKNQHGMGAGFIIGFPMFSTGQVVVDYVAYSKGEILEIARPTQNVSSHSKLLSILGSLKSR
jgi:hypothetical protein